MHEWTSDTVSDFCAEQTALLLPKERRFKLSSAFLVRNDGNLYRLIMFFPALDKSQLAGFTEAKYDISDRLEGKIFRIWLKIPKTLAKFKWDGKWGPMKSAIFTKMAPEFDKDGFVGNWNHASENRGSCDAASFVTARLRREISFWAVLWRTQTHEDEFFFLFLNRNFSKLACGPQEFNSREIHLHLTF